MEVFSERRFLILFVLLALCVSLLVIPVHAAAQIAPAGFQYYNGVLLPELPPEAANYSYASIVYTGGIDGFWDYQLALFDGLGYISSTPVDNLAGGRYMYFVPGGCESYMFYRFYDELGEWSAFLDPTVTEDVFLVKWVDFPENGLIWANVDLYNEDGSIAISGSAPSSSFDPVGSIWPHFTVDLVPFEVYSYALNQHSSALHVNALASVPGAEYTYTWQVMTGKFWEDVPNESPDSRYFYPPTDAPGRFQYRCRVNVDSIDTHTYGYSSYVYVVVSDSDSAAVVSPGDQIVIDQLGDISDSLNASSPDLDSSIGDLEDSSVTVDRFEDEQWNNINDNIGDVTGAFDAFKDGSLAAAFTFLGGIVNNTFDSLGNWQVVLTLPLALGLILYICSRAPLNSIPRVRDQAAAEVEAVKRADMRQAETAYRKSYEYYRSERNRRDSYAARYKAERGI